MDGIAKYVIDFILRPGSALTLVPFINLSVVGLVLMLFCLYSWHELDSHHFIVMTVLSVGLLASVNWFYYEYRKITAAQSEQSRNGESLKRSD